MKKYTINRIVFASLLALALPTTALAASPVEKETIRLQVAWDDLNIDSASGTRILYTRVERAAEQACGVATLTELGSVKRVHDAKECFDYVVDKAVRQIDSDKLSKVHSS